MELPDKGKLHFVLNSCTIYVLQVYTVSKMMEQSNVDHTNFHVICRRCIIKIFSDKSKESENDFDEGRRMQAR